MNGTMDSRVYPNWYTKARVRKADAQGNPDDGFAFNGELVAVSPRFQRGGVHFRVRPERPAAFFAAFCYEHGLLPELLTPEEASSEWGLQLLESLWQRHKTAFPLLSSPFAASDADTVPDLHVGFSFNIRQKLIDVVGSVKPAAARSAFRPAVVGQPSRAIDLEAARATILAMRARAGHVPPTPVIAVADEPPGEDDEELAAMRAELAAQRERAEQAVPPATAEVATPDPTPEPEPAPAPTTNGRKRHR